MKKPGNVRGRIIDEQDVYHSYTVMLEPMISIAKRHQVTRQAVWYCLRRLGVDTDKVKNGNIEVKCTWCKKSVTKKRSQVRDRRHIFCGEHCYYAWLNRKDWSGQPFIESNRGKKEAREVVSRYMLLLPGDIVHHEDRNQCNNALENLRVFNDAGEHTRYHRGFYVEPVWDGRYPHIVRDR